MNASRMKRQLLAACAALSLVGTGSAAVPMPEGYTQLDWIESTGGQWIDTGVNGNEKTKLEMDCTYVRAINGTSGKDEFFGSQVDNYGSKALSFSVYRNGSGFIASALSYDVKGDWLMQGNYTPQAGVRYQVILDAPSRTFSFISGGQTVNTTTHPAFTSGSTVGSILLCSVRNNGNPMKERCSYLRIYSATITEGGEAVRTFVPCRNDKGEAGLWDSVEGLFYGNASGVGRFFGPNDVSSGIRMGYIESHGAQWIDTGVKGTAKTKVEMDCTYLQPVAYSEFFGSQVSGHNPAALSFSVYNNGSGNIASALNTAATGDWKSNNKYKPVPGTRYLAVLDAPNKLFTFSTVAADGTTTEVDRLVRDTAPTGETLDSILLCCERQNGNLLSARCSCLRIHSVRIYSGNTLAHEFVPGLSVDGRVGLIDTKDGDRFFGNASGTGDFTAGGLTYTMDGTTMKAYNGPLSTKALEGHSTVELADGSFTLEDDCAVNGTLKLTGGAKITFGLTADENDSLSATSVDLSKASAAKPVEILLDMSSAPDSSERYILVLGGLAAGDEAKFHVADGNAVLAVENGALVLTFPNYDLKVSDVSVRQFWPWNTKVTVDMTVSGVVQGKAHPLALDAYTEDTLLGTIPAEALSPAPVVDRNGKWSFTFDPTKVGFLSDRGAVPGFKIVPSASADNVLYVDIDLTKAAGEPGQVTYITEEDITSGKYGEWKRKYWDAGADEIAWTGVTADDKYKTTHLVMRRIPAGTFKMGSPITENTRGYDGGTQDRLQTEVTLTKPYYIGVFEVTQSQWEKMNSGSAVAGDITPACGISYDDIRGDGKTMNGPYDWPRTTAVDPNSLIGKFRVQTGIPFDLPTEAQWEKAARAGTDGAYYDGTVQPDEEKLDKLAWYNNNNPDTHKKVQNVGLKKPNNYGLYDMLGNAMEYVLDCYIAGSVEETVDPVGPLANKDLIPRIRKGGQCNWAYDWARSAFRRVDWHAATYQAGQGFRLAMPAQW